MTAKKTTRIDHRYHPDHSDLFDAVREEGEVDWGDQVYNFDDIVKVCDMCKKRWCALCMRESESLGIHTCYDAELVG